MSLVVNHNMMASNVARNLNAHYGRLATSTERLSTGMRVNSAADDAAGLAIRELMRADIASLQQGARNANDAISMIQTADGALGVIDEKLVRMKELAEQAATGTYDSTQRLMIESEYQAMAKEITRIAYATDFNGIHLLDGSLQGDHDGSGLSATGKMKIHFGTGNDSAEDYYYVEIGESTAAAFGVGMDSTWEDAVNRLVKTFSSNLKNSLENLSLTDATLQEAVENASKNWVSEFENGLKELSQFSNADDLQKLYTAFKYDSEVSKISSLFEKSIANYAGITDRERQKMEYALGRAAMRALAENNSVMTGFGDKVNTYPITDSTEGMLSSNTNSAFSRRDDGSVINYNSTYKLVFIPPNDYNAAKYKAETGEYAPSSYPLSFTTPILTSQIPINNVVTNGTEQFTFNFDGSLLSYSDDSGATVTTYKDARIDSVSDGTTIQAYSSITDSSGNPLQLKYIDTNGVTYYIEDANNNTPDYFYDQSTNIGSKTYFDGTAAANPIKYENNTNNTITLISGTNPTTHIDATGGVTSFYSGGTLIESYIDTYGNTTNFDTTGTYPTDYTDTYGNITQFDSNNDITSYYNATEGSKSTYDTNGALTSYTARDGSRVDFDYTSTPSTIQVYGSDGRIVEEGSGAYENILQNAITKGNLDYTSAQAAKANALAAQAAATTAQTDAGTNISNATTDQGIVTALDRTALTPTSYASALQQTSSVSASDSQIQSVYDAIANTLTSSLTVTANAAETYDYAGFTIATQEDAQEALTSLNKAIEVKDKIRADLGALQNRFENTITNLNTQAENLQAAESRISDTDVSTEMTQFVRNQILTQSAVAMLAQANSLPQMAMQLIGG